MSIIPPSLPKPVLRAAALARRDALSEPQRQAAALALAARPFPIDIAPGIVVAGYAPLRSEFDPRPLLAALATRGAKTALPMIVGRDQPLSFRLWSPGAPLIRGPLGILEPSPDSAAAIPDILLVPLAAFDRAGHRIGYGGGYYDRSLAQLRASGPKLAIGIGFAVQEIPAIPALAHDARLDLVLTEAETIDLRSA
uniref:5-formyltetrahydrofolate cyclo-ligase n=1 Tax=Rhodopseudomonas palustris (strain BisA53) TaxID=316055 RepID=Q07H90_RHOP5